MPREPMLRRQVPLCFPVSPVVMILEAVITIS